MRIIGKIFLAIVLTGTALSLSAYYEWYKPKFKPAPHIAYRNTYSRADEEFTHLREKAALLKTFAAAHRYNQQTCFLVDMSLPSGQSRFFVFDLQQDSILLGGLVAHGSCDNGFRANPSFSNRINSGCSSLGKYKIGNSYKGNFGLAYKLYGLDSLNSNALQRNIVLHSYDCVPEQETNPSPICNSRGCPMVSPGFLQQLKTVLDRAKGPILLWIFN